MKKIITLLLTAGIFTATYAQKNHGHQDDYGRNDQYATTSNGRYDNGDQDRDDPYNRRNNSNATQIQMQMERINQEYNYQVMSIQQNVYMNNRQKRLAIRDAQKERNYKLQMVNRQSNGYANNGNSYGKYGNNGYGKHDDDDRR
jgi:hypothetical protein